MTIDVLPADSAGVPDARRPRRLAWWAVGGIALALLAAGLIAAIADGGALPGWNAFARVDGDRALRGLGKLVLGLGAAALLAVVGSALSSLSERVEKRRQASREG